MPARASSGGCTDVGATAAKTGSGGYSFGGGPGNGSCSDVVVCLADTACGLNVHADVSGLGVVGVAIAVDGVRLATCEYQLGACAADAGTSIPAREGQEVACQFFFGAAIEISMACSWTVDGGGR
jgi:hypothetical protein